MTTPSGRWVAVITKNAQANGDMTHYAIAKRAGIRESTISRTMSGRTVPSVATLTALADAYDVSLDELVGRRVRTLPRQRRRSKVRAAA